MSCCEAGARSNSFGLLLVSKQHAPAEGATRWSSTPGCYLGIAPQSVCGCVQSARGVSSRGRGSEAKMHVSGSEGPTHSSRAHE